MNIYNNMKKIKNGVRHHRSFNIGCASKPNRAMFIPSGLSKESPQQIAFPALNRYLVLYAPIANERQWYSKSKTILLGKKYNEIKAYQICDILHNYVLHKRHTLRKRLTAQKHEKLSKLKVGRYQMIMMLFIQQTLPSQ